MDQLNRIEATLVAHGALLAQLVSGVATAAAAPLPAYERPPLGIDAVIADGTTINGDGSIWATSKGEQGPVGTVYQVALGYISERKFPEIWGAARRLYAPDAFAAWEAAWRANPYGIYKADPRPMIAAGTITFVNFNMAMGQPFTSSVQGPNVPVDQGRSGYDENGSTVPWNRPGGRSLRLAGKTFTLYIEPPAGFEGTREFSIDPSAPPIGSTSQYTQMKVNIGGQVYDYGQYGGDFTPPLSGRTVVTIELDKEGAIFFRLV